MPRDDFSPAVKRDLAMRAAYICSNPRCLRLTAGPQIRGRRATQTGHAAHICAAAEGGPRFDGDQTSEERRAIENAIWLCRECGDMVDKDHSGHPAPLLRSWRYIHEAMIAEVRQKGWSNTIELLRSSHAQPAVARQLIALFEDRRAFWARFDAEFPDRVRLSLDALRHDLTGLRSNCASGSPLDSVIVALAQTVRLFFDMVEHLDLVTLRCNSNDPDWLAFETALRALRKSIGFQITQLADSYSIALTGEFAEHTPHTVSWAEP